MLRTSTIHVAINMRLAWMIGSTRWRSIVLFDQRVMAKVKPPWARPTLGRHALIYCQMFNVAVIFQGQTWRNDTVLEHVTRRCVLILFIVLGSWRKQVISTCTIVSVCCFCESSFEQYFKGPKWQNINASDKSRYCILFLCILERSQRKTMHVVRFMLW